MNSVFFCNFKKFEKMFLLLILIFQVQVIKSSQPSVVYNMTRSTDGQQIQVKHADGRIEFKDLQKKFSMTLYLIQYEEYLSKKEKVGSKKSAACWRYLALGEFENLSGSKIRTEINPDLSFQEESDDVLVFVQPIKDKNFTKVTTKMTRSPYTIYENIYANLEINYSNPVYLKVLQYNRMLEDQILAEQRRAQVRITTK